MYLVLVRHSFSNKNALNNFSSKRDNEALTKKGKMDVERLASELHDFLARKSLTLKHVYSTTSIRAIETSQIIASKLCTDIKSHESLKSIRSAFSGKSEDEVRRNNPLFYSKLTL